MLNIDQRVLPPRPAGQGRGHLGGVVGLTLGPVAAHASDSVGEKGTAAGLVHLAEVGATAGLNL
eukprot:161002-Alexandrium_andersonii.AAC.1